MAFFVNISEKCLNSLNQDQEKKSLFSSLFLSCPLLAKKKKKRENCSKEASQNILKNTFLNKKMYVVAVQSLSCVQLFATPWTVAHQALLSMEFSRQEYWSELPLLSPGGISLTQGLNLCLLNWQADSIPLSHLESPILYIILCIC